MISSSLYNPLLEPLAEAIAKRAKGGTSLFADDTPKVAHPCLQMIPH